MHRSIRHTGYSEKADALSLSQCCCADGKAKSNSFLRCANVRCRVRLRKCINQEDAPDIAREIPRMTEYYPESMRCVVVSEMLRRGCSHRPDRLRHDFLDPTCDEEPPPEHLTERDGALYGLEDEVIGWLVGFHQFETGFPDSISRNPLFIMVEIYVPNKRYLDLWHTSPLYLGKK
ncbi:hypothetical protein GJ744_010328 [Endocarpon pusillum]|uniref:Uncharacterized protein n=1 Tax=Endocarpon pusillum TaxID=364733 RepID=A0A8H7E311_9EURO|nr:hypothetical protein GJ744_010328 [Endocarpon pusillum]